MLKGSKEALTVLIVTHVTHVKKVKRAHDIFTHNFLNIQLIFNLKKVLKSWDLDLSNYTTQCYVCQSMLKGSKVEITFDPFNIHSIGWKGLSLSFTKLFWIENQLNIKKVMSKNVMSHYSMFWRGQNHFIKSTLLTLLTWVRWVTFLCIQHCVKATNTTFDPFNMSYMSNN